ncbi:MAG: S-adenosylmethionine:tRNA ribosyltransferase-isomerase [Chitinophagaceae bacterium]
MDFNNTTVGCVMEHPGKIVISDYTYLLPEERIASYPLAQRDASKLLIYHQGDLTEDIYKNIAGHIPPQSFLVFNNTKVVEARLLFQKPSGGMIEIFCLGPVNKDTGSGMQQQGKVLWECLVGGASKWKRGQVLEKKIETSKGQAEILLRAVYVEKTNDAFIIELSWTQAELSFAELLHQAGAIPLPPYIKRIPEESDKERYQTMYARFDGSVAAPTAGLHFTDAVFESLRQKQVDSDFVTLHVGAGTFKPVKTNTLQDHAMHAEFIEVSRSFIQNLVQHLDKNIIAVGTTSLRTLESLYWLGVKLSRESGIQSREAIKLSQWDAYELADNNIPVKDGLEALLEWMDKNKLEQLITSTQLLIAPGYPFKIVNGLITNFHQPQSTLLLLVAAFIGENWKKVYEYALQNDYRFLSFGDGSLLWRRE